MLEELGTLAKDTIVTQSETNVLGKQKEIYPNLGRKTE